MINYKVISMYVRVPKSQSFASGDDEDVIIGDGPP
jgi:hypothetical protein